MADEAEARAWDEHDYPWEYWDECNKCGEPMNPAFKHQCPPKQPKQETSK